jgi:2-keto-4-pentenoate hydratase/2-oxohepta-3-ene-1,7-dioic acid hydratase in catechol pathway
MSSFAKLLRKITLGVVVPAALLTSMAAVAADEDGGDAVRYVRYRHDGKVSWGIVEGESVRRLEGNLLTKWHKTDDMLRLADVRILVPTRPSKVFALAGNYRDHLGDREPPKIPQPFIKLPSCLQRHEGVIRLPSDTHDVHYEAELVVVIGKRATKVSEEDALDYVLGVTCGNDISARIWQNGTAEHTCEKCGHASDADVQWWRAKASDTFGPCGPFILSGVDYQKLDMTLRVNGEVRQKTNTKNQVHGIAQVVSFLSKHCTLEPGDLIYTGTPGKTQALKPGDEVEVEIEKVGVLKNRVVQAKN